MGRKEEIEKRLAEIDEELGQIHYKLEQLDAQQFTRKLVLNSSYGALSSRSNPIGDDDLANAITMMGSASIQQVNVIAEEWVRGETIRVCQKRLDELSVQAAGELTPEQRAKLDADVKRYTDILRSTDDPKAFREGIIVFNDTDSSGFSFSKVPTVIFEKKDGLIEITPEGYDLVERGCEEINDEFNRWYVQATNSANPILNFKREKICDLGIWLKKGKEDEEAKKNYIVRVIDSEGAKHFDGKYFKYTGVKLARSVVPKVLKDLAKEVVEDGVFSRSRHKADALVQKLYDAYVVMPVDDKAAIQRCNNMEKYVNPATHTFVLGTPGHIRAAATYNAVIEQEGFVHLEPLRSGDTAKIVQVYPDNKWGVEKIAYKDSWPPEFDELFRLDNRVGFEKIIYDEIARIYKSVDWGSFNPAQNFSVSLLDLIGL